MVYCQSAGPDGCSFLNVWEKQENIEYSSHSSTADMCHRVKLVEGRHVLREGDWCFLFSMPAPRPFPQCTRTMGATSAIVSVLCVVSLCLSVLEAPTVSLRHVRNAAREVGG